MKRHSFALTILLASIAGPLVTVGSARCQSEKPIPRNQCEVCPLLEEYCTDFLNYCQDKIAEARYDDPIDPRFDPETGRYIGHDVTSPIDSVTEHVASDAEIAEFYTGYDKTYDAEVYGAYAAETIVEEAKPEATDVERYNEEYYDDYQYAAENYWYDDAVETAEVVADEPAEVADEAIDYDYSYDEYDNYDYDYETYDYEAYDYEAEVVADSTTPESPAVEAEKPVAAYQNETVVPTPPTVDEEVLAAENAAARELWDYETQGYDPYEYDYEAYHYEYEVYEQGAVATPVEAAPAEPLTSEHEADFAETWTDESDSSDYNYDYGYEYDYDYGYEYNYESGEPVETETNDTAAPQVAPSPVAAAVSRQVLLNAAQLLDNLSQVLKNASLELERTAAIDSNFR